MNKLDYIYMMCKDCNRAIVIKRNETIENCPDCNSTWIATFNHNDICDKDSEAWSRCVVKGR